MACQSRCSPLTWVYCKIYIDFCNGFFLFQPLTKVDESDSDDDVPLKQIKKDLQVSDFFL